MEEQKQNERQTDFLSFIVSDLRALMVKLDETQKKNTHDAALVADTKEIKKSIFIFIDTLNRLKTNPQSADENSLADFYSQFLALESVYEQLMSATGKVQDAPADSGALQKSEYRADMEPNFSFLRNIEEMEPNSHLLQNIELKNAPSSLLETAGQFGLEVIKALSTWILEALVLAFAGYVGHIIYPLYFGSMIFPMFDLMFMMMSTGYRGTPMPPPVFSLCTAIAFGPAAVAYRFIFSHEDFKKYSILSNLINLSRSLSTLFSTEKPEPKAENNKSANQNSIAPTTFFKEISKEDSISEQIIPKILVPNFDSPNKIK